MKREGRKKKSWNDEGREKDEEEKEEEEEEKEKDDDDERMYVTLATGGARAPE